MEEIQVKDEVRPPTPVAGLYRRQEGHTAVKDGLTRYGTELVGGEDGGEDREEVADKSFGE